MIQTDVLTSLFNIDQRTRSPKLLVKVAADQGTAQPRRLVVVVVVLVPITVRMPAVLVFIPPLMPLTPATLSRFVQFPTLVICLFAVASVFVNCLVEFMLCVSDSALTSVLVFCLQARHGGAKQNRCKSD